ncbi:hypothetical protein [Neobacillus vireti]|uniref:Uncharacterized protein n=1 Tax=Neobacillus vireti LMG 21834 TaxID=1131730 RepID=A0AB94INL8_9BACI|nr:hypothetical protein [Neobacillus vireti]ETI68558.1 hypothetical protein BAVI_12054 [Neobacillus vireti LMG 21834]KLT16204.1 hypothetical protein AA980_19790 [Neobacillus vireti]
MKKNRYLLCLLLVAFMLYFAVPRLSIHATGAEGIFSIAWLAFALMVIAGNLTGLLYSPKKHRQRPQFQNKKTKSRSFLRE